MKNVKLADKKLNKMLEILEKDGVVCMFERQKIYGNVTATMQYEIIRLSGDTYQLSHIGIFDKHLMHTFKDPFTAVNYFKGKEILKIK